MNVEISPDDEELLHTLVDAGAFTSVEDAVHISIAVMASRFVRNEPEKRAEDWFAYAGERIQAGLDDVAAGRVISLEDFLARGEAFRRKSA